MDEPRMIVEHHISPNVRDECVVWRAEAAVAPISMRIDNGSEVDSAGHKRNVMARLVRDELLAGQIHFLGSCFFDVFDPHWYADRSEYLR